MELVAEKVGKSLREGDFVRVLVVLEMPEWLVRQYFVAELFLQSPGLTDEKESMLEESV